MPAVLMLLDFVPNQERAFEEFLLRCAHTLHESGWHTCFVFSGEPSERFATRLRAEGAMYRVARFPLTREGSDDLIASLAGVCPVVMTNAFVSCFSPYVLHLKKRLCIRHWLVHDETSGTASPKAGLRLLMARARGWYYGRHIDRVLAVSEFVARRNVEQAFLPAARVKVLRNAVDLERFSPGPGADDGSPEEARVVFVGQLIPEKGIQTLLRAIALLSHGASPAPLRVDVAGTGTLEADLRTYAAANGLHNVHFLGQVSDVPTLYRSATVVVVPSEWAEAAAFVIAEALSCGACVLASDAGGNPDLIGREQEDGALFRSGDAADLAEKLAALLADREARTRYRIRARARAERMFRLDQMVDGFVREVQDVCRQ